MPPKFSLIVPTRNNIEILSRFLDSIKRTASDINSIEIVLVMDTDDQLSKNFVFDGVNLHKVVVAPGISASDLRIFGYNASSGQYVMLLTDDVVIRSEGWDSKILSEFSRFPDGIAMVHVNDLIFKEKFCPFPVVSRKYCQIVGGLSPEGYARYRIDDHIFNIFNMLGVLGKRRIVYRGDLIFEHVHYIINKNGEREYKPNEKILETDEKLFRSQLSQRKAAVIRLLEYMDDFSTEKNKIYREALLEQIQDSFSIRRPEYLFVQDIDYPADQADKTNVMKKRLRIQREPRAPKIIEERDNHNLVNIGKRYFIVDKSLGKIDLLQEYVGERDLSPVLFVFDNLEEAVLKMKALQGERK